MGKDIIPMEVKIIISQEHKLHVYAVILRYI